MEMPPVIRYDGRLITTIEIKAEEYIVSDSMIMTLTGKSVEFLRPGSISR
jgi:hypothetical protein